MRRERLQGVVVALLLAAAAAGQASQGGQGGQAAPESPAAQGGQAARAALEAAIGRQKEAAATQNGAAARQREAVRVQESLAGPWPWPDPPELQASAPPPPATVPPEAGAEPPEKSSVTPSKSDPETSRSALEWIGIVPALDPGSIFDPLQSSRTGARILARLLARYGSGLGLKPESSPSVLSGTDAWGILPEFPAMAPLFSPDNTDGRGR